MGAEASTVYRLLDLAWELGMQEVVNWVNRKRREGWALGMSPLPGSKMDLNEMIGRLYRVLGAMEPYRTQRLEEKWSNRESYENHALKGILENLGRNVVQFTTAVACGDTSGALKQGADILNLTLMALDKSTEILE
jgi:transposase